jgi:prophage DNA circulation protein
MDENQRKINEMCGVSEETFAKYSKGIPSDDAAVDHIVAKSDIIDEDQRRINQLCGVSDLVFLEHTKSLQRTSPANQTRAQRMTDLVRDAERVLAKHHARLKQPPETIDDSQRKINEMCGVTDETFLKYNK